MTHNLGMAPYRLPGPGICPPDFKPPSESSQITSAPSNPKKRRKTSSAAANQMPSQPPPSPQDLLPPPLTGYGDTIVASNPFDDTPTNPPMSHALGHMGMHGGGMNPHMHHHMGGPPMRGMSPLGMGNMSPMGNMGPMGPGGMQCGGPMPHMNSRGGGMSPMGGMPGATMGGMSPMGNMGPSISPMGPMGGLSPMGGPPNSHMGMNPNMGPNGNRSIGSPMSGGPIGSPMNSLPMGSPMGNAMGSPLGGGPGHINNGQMGPPMHSPLGNGPSHMPGPRINVPNGAMPSTGGPIPHQMNQMMGGGGNNPMTSSAQMTTTNSMNTMVGSMGGHPHSHSPMNHQNVPMTQGSGPMNSGHLGNPINSGMSHGMSMGPMGPSHLVHMGHMGGPGGGPMNGPPNQIGSMFGPKPMPVSAGKMYPPGQPMVFNPQNPNAPPIYPCGHCHKEVNDNDEALFCESGCRFFFHRTCGGLTEAAFQLISKEPYAEWCCDKCLSSKVIQMVRFN